MPKDEREIATNLFVSWLQQRGVIMSPKASLVDMAAKGRGRGLVANMDFEQDEIIFTIPRSVVLNVDNAASNRISAAAMVDMPKWLSLTAVVMMEMLEEISNSNWSSYLAVLPSKLDSLVFWSSEELAELQASSVLQKIGKDNAEAMFDKHILGLGIPAADVEIFHRVASLVMAYAFDIPEQRCESINGSCTTEECSSGDEYQDTVMAMVPLADMLNADANSNNAHLTYNAKDLEMRTTKSISKGQEIYNDYGPLPRSALLRCYGYVADSYTRYDVVELSTTFIVSAFQEGLLANGELSHTKCLQKQDLDARIELARREGIHEDSYDISHASSEEPCIPTEMLALVFILLVDEDTFSFLRISQKSLPGRSKMTTELVGLAMKGLLQMRENCYKTTLEEDEVLLRAGNLSHRRTMAIKVRHGEKMVLREAIKEAASFQGSDTKMRKRTTLAQQANTPKKTKTK